MATPEHQTCAFCGYEGSVPDEVRPTGEYVCVDTEACDAREEREHREVVEAIRRDD